MPRFVLAAVLFACALACALTTAPATSTARAATPARTDPAPSVLPIAGPLRSDGRFLRDRHGRAVFIHGMNVVWKHAPYVPPSTLHGASTADSRFDERDAALLAANGWNGVRLGVLWAGVEPRPTRYDLTYLRRSRELVQLLGRHGVSVLVDSHQDMYTEAYRGEGFPDWARFDRGIRPLNCCAFPLNYASPSSVATWNDFWANRALLWTRFRNQWTLVAATMRDLDNVVGYDLINEPWAGGSWRRCLILGGCTTFETQRLQRMQEHVIGGIRSVDARSPVWWEANTLTSFGRPNRVGAYRPVRDPARNTVLSFHAYCLLGGSVPFLSRAADPTCPAVHRSTFAQAASASRRNRSAAVLTEFGASDDVVDIARVARMADATMTSWYYWHYGAWRDPTGVVASQGLFADDADRGSLKQAKADVLVRTYPQAVAGLPMSFSFAPERADRRFHLTWVAQARIAAPTVISVPVARHYPEGYDVLVQGPARVTSAPDAPLLQLEATGDGLVYLRLVRRGFTIAG